MSSSFLQTPNQPQLSTSNDLDFSQWTKKLEIIGSKLSPILLCTSSSFDSFLLFLPFYIHFILRINFCLVIFNHLIRSFHFIYKHAKPPYQTQGEKTKQIYCPLYHHPCSAKLFWASHYLLFHLLIITYSLILCKTYLYLHFNKIPLSIYLVLILHSKASA